MKLSRFFLLLLLVTPRVVLADAYSDARSELVAAYQAGDFAAMRIAASKALDARPGFPGALFNRALAEVLDEDADAALDTLHALLDRHVDFGVDGMPEFEPLKEHPGWDEYVAEVGGLYTPQGEAAVAYTYDDGNFVLPQLPVAT